MISSVENRNPQTLHSRRLRIVPPLGLESMTLEFVE